MVKTAEPNPAGAIAYFVGKSTAWTFTQNGRNLSVGNVDLADIEPVKLMLGLLGADMLCVTTQQGCITGSVTGRNVTEAIQKLKAAGIKFTAMEIAR